MNPSIYLREDIRDKTVPELKIICSDLGLDTTNTKTKTGLVNLILDKQPNAHLLSWTVAKIREECRKHNIEIDGKESKNTCLKLLSTKKLDAPEVKSFSIVVPKKDGLVVPKINKSFTDSVTVQKIYEELLPKVKKVEVPKVQRWEYKKIKTCLTPPIKQKEAKPKVVQEPSFTITLEELLKEIENPQFIRDFKKSLEDLMKEKEVIYNKKLKELTTENADMNLRIKKMQQAGISDRAIEDIFPYRNTIVGYIIDIQIIIQAIQSKRISITEQKVKDNLLEAITNQEEGIQSLIGRNGVKNQIAAQLYSFSKGYKTFVGSFNNIIIFGAAGVGKTALAKVIAFVFSRVGVMIKNSVKMTTRSDFIGSYIGQTAPKTRAVLMSTLEAVLFIDEAYQLSPFNNDPGARDFGPEAVTEIVNFLDKFVGLSIVIAAGYEEQMKKGFLGANEGMSRRFPFRYNLFSYKNNELTDILLNNLIRKLPPGVEIDYKIRNYIYSLICDIKCIHPEVFCNQAGDMLNLSASISKIINASYKIKWENDIFWSNKLIINAGFDDFLSVKDTTIILK